MQLDAQNVAAIAADLQSISAGPEQLERTLVVVQHLPIEAAHLLVEKLRLRGGGGGSPESEVLIGILDEQRQIRRPGPALSCGDCRPLIYRWLSHIITLEVESGRTLRIPVVPSASPHAGGPLARRRLLCDRGARGRGHQPGVTLR
jgi:hypothetical protein